MKHLSHIRGMIPAAILFALWACSTPEKTALKSPAPPADWSAPDPTLDTIKRYRPLFKMELKPGDYPSILREEGVSRITVYCTLLVRADGVIQDVKVRRMSSRANDHGPFRRVITRMARNAALKRMKLISKPYRVDGKPSPFIWETRLEFAPR